MTPSDSMVPNPPTAQDLEYACLEIMMSSRESAQVLIDEMNKSIAICSMLAVGIKRNPEAEVTIHNFVIRSIAIGILAERQRRHGQS